ncbi:hypothetical protein B0H19DRAFT_1081751 [Mycena capillaripes]|nr:hypothetical protein B0H19DRAFT_1081751 [Mycena capillaripes]
MSRGGGPVASSASRSSAVPSMEASLNAQIQDLVQRNRTLEHTNKKLADEMAIEADRAKRGVRDMQTKFNEDRASWREGCNRLLSNHHLAHLRASAKLSNVEAALLKEMELSRQEKVARLHRDFQITMFRIREGELEAKVEELEDLLADARREQDGHFSELEERIKAQDEEMANLEEEKSTAEKELLKIRESYGRLQVAAESTKTKLERLNLQFDGAQTTNTELERQNDELKRANVDIKRQLDKWQNLETKGGEEVATLRKQRIDLEVEVKALESRLEKKEGELQKERTKVAKHKRNVDEFQAYIDEQREEAKDVANQLAKAKKQVERLQLELDAERAARPISPLKRQASPTVSEDEVANDFAEVAPPSSPAKPPSKKPPPKVIAAAPSKGGRKKPASEMVAGPSNAPDSDIEKVPDPKNPKTRPRAKAKALGAQVNGSKAKPRSRTAGRDSSESEDDTRSAKNKGKGKAVEVVDDSGSDVAQKESPRSKTAIRGKRKREEPAGGASNKKRAPSEVPEVVERPKPKPRGKAVGGGRAGSIQPRGTTVVSDEESDEPAKKKKKRTIGLFPANSQPTSFNFLPIVCWQFSFTPLYTDNDWKGDAGGIDIPTMLSPVRETDVVPNRSAPSRTGSTNSLVGSIGGLFSSFGKRKQ